MSEPATSAGSEPRYDPARTYEWNYEHAPVEPRPEDGGPIVEPACPGRWNVGGKPVASPLGVAAGPLLNGRWVLHYARLGFDLLTYKTVRSQARECYPWPNLVPVAHRGLVGGDEVLLTQAEMSGSWAISFGMPSRSPDEWRRDVEWTKQHLPAGKLLSVSVVGSADAGSSLVELARDFAQCACWAAASGADCIECNFSCPNVCSQDGQLYQQPSWAREVAATVREALPTEVPLLIKLGFVSDEAGAEQLVSALSPFATGLVMTNCLAARVVDPAGAWQFAGERRGIGGDAIRHASVEQVRRFANVVRRLGAPLQLIGVGGVRSAEHAREYLAAGASGVHLATAAMLDPHVGLSIRAAWAREA